MAKVDGVSFFERHVEKVVLLVCVVLLGVAVSRWVFSSPVALSVIHERGRGLRKDVPPEDVDKILRTAARNVKKTYDDAQLKVAPIPKWASDVQALRPIEPPLARELDLGLARLPVKTEVIRLRGPRVRLADLVKVLPAPPRPSVAAYLELPNREPLADTLVARGQVAYPIGKLREAWGGLLKETSIPVNVVMQSVTIEVQQALPDGQWGPAKAISSAVRPDEDGNTMVAPKIRDFDGKNVEEVREDRNALAEGKWQDHILRPNYYQIWLATGGGAWGDWKTHLQEAPPEEDQELIWFHDDATMKFTGRYRYRVRLAFVNPLLTYEEELGPQAAADARQKAVVTQPSEWSQGVSLERKIHFFLTGANPMAKSMIVTVFAHKWGQTVRKTFPIRPGEPIGSQAKVPVRDPLGEAGARKTVAVDFGTGGIAMRFYFGAKIPGPGGLPLTTSKMLYLDSGGSLESRVQARDERDPLQRQLVREVQQVAGGE